MGTLRTTFSIARIGDNSQLLTDALAIYAKSIEPSIRTATNDIAYWAGRYNRTFTDELLLFAFQVNGVTAGYAELVLFRSERLLVADYIVIDRAMRGNSAFFAFIELIEGYFDEHGMEYDSVVTEVASFSETDEPLAQSRRLIRLLKFAGFGILKARYFQAPLGMNNAESIMRATLLIRRRDPQASIKRETFLTIVRTIYFKHYLRWYEPLPGYVAKDYRRLVNELLERVEASVKGQYVKINGSWEGPPEQPIATPAHKAFVASRPFVAMIFLVLLALACVQYAFRLSAISIATLAVVALTIVFAVLTVFSSKAKFAFQRIMLTLGRMCGRKE